MTDTNTQTLIFTYGTLKRGFINHDLMENLIQANDAVFLGVHRTAHPYPLVCGPYRVPFLLNFPGNGEHVWGEVYAVSDYALAQIDKLEGTDQGHYERLGVEVLPDGGDRTLLAQAYYAHQSYALNLWKKNGMKGFSTYTKTEADGYVKRMDRPHNLSFHDHIHAFLISDDSVQTIEEKQA